MKKLSQQTSLFGLFISIIFLLTACGGSNSNPSSAPANTQATLNISNKTNVDFTNISIEEGFTGKTLYSGNFKCASKETGCVLFYTGPEFTGPIVLTFKDSHGHIAAAYDTPVSPGNYLAADVSLWSTGAYLYDALTRRNSTIAQMGQSDIESRLDLFTKNSAKSNITGYDDNNIDLALYYINKIQHGSLSVNDFLDGLAQRLIDFEVADSSEFSVTSTSIAGRFNDVLSTAISRLKSLEFIKSAHAQSTDCSGNTVSFLTFTGSVAGGVANAYPLAGTVGSAISALLMNSCTNIVTELNIIISQLTNLQNSLDNLQNRMGMLTNFVASSQMSTNIQEFSDTVINLTQLSKNYQLILTNNNVKSLGEYVKLKGGNGSDALAITLQKEGYNGRLEDLINRTGETVDKNYLLQVDRLTSQLDLLIGALDLLCNDPGPGSSIVKQRIQCNLVISTTTAKLIAAQTMAYKLASETFDLLEAYPSEATRFGYDLRKTAAENKAELSIKYQAQINNLIAKYRDSIQNGDGSSGYYNAFNGIPETLLRDMVAFNCKYDVSGSAAISEWFKTGGDDYIETLCKDNQTPIKARYYFKVGGAVANSNSIANVLGVLVDAEAVKGPYEGAGLEPLTTSRGTTYDKLALKMSNTPISGTFSVNSNLKSRVGVRQISSGLSDGSIRGDFFQLSQYPYQNNLFASSGLTLLKITLNDGSTPYSWFRYTDSTKISYAFAINQVFGISCLTSDCSATGYDKTASPKRIGYVSFKNGPQKLGFAMYNDVNTWNPPNESVGLAAFYLDSKLMY